MGQREHTNPNAVLPPRGTGASWPGGRGRLICIVVGVLTLLQTGCAVLPRGDAVPPQLVLRAMTPEAPYSRYWPNLDLDRMLRAAAQSDDRERQALQNSGIASAQLPPADYLAISGGGDSGPFAAGILVGWTSFGNRPAFKVVTGISAGALVAPFAFIGSRYDALLTAACISTGPRDVFRPRNLLSAVTGDSYADVTPLEATIDKYITRELLDAVAHEYARGRLLLVGTTDLDHHQPVVWNMGEIASSPDPKALLLFRKVLLASAAIPGFFPPVMIDVEVDGKHYQEMHVDGGVLNQVFFAPPHLVQALNDPASSFRRARHLYVIRNGRLEPKGAPVPRRTLQVARQALQTLIESQGIDDMVRLQQTAEREGEQFSVAFIDAGFNYPHRATFSSDFMTHLFDYSYSLAAQGYPWRAAVPGVDPSTPEAGEMPHISAIP